MAALRVRRGGAGLLGVARLCITVQSVMASFRVSTTTDTSEAEASITSAAGQLPLVEPVARQEIRSYYWWEGKVQNDPEVRLSFATTADFDQVVEVLGSAHNYDVPMIIAPADKPQATHWRGSIPGGTAELAERLASARVVACAQLDPDQLLTVKTVAAAKPAVEEMVASPVQWESIVGNQPYLDWLEAETKPKCTA